MVRETSSRGWSASSVTADGDDPNSAYASSTTTTPEEAAQTAATTSRGVTVPVGLFGVVRNVIAGWCSSTAATAADRDSEKSAARGTATQPVAVPEASSGCIAYDGSNPSA